MKGADPTADRVPPPDHDSACYAVLDISPDALITLRARAPFRRPHVDLLMDGALVARVSGRMAPSDDQPDAVEELPPAWLDGRPHILRAVTDRGEDLFGEAGCFVRFAQRVVGRIEATLPDGRVAGFIEASGLATEHLPARLVVDGLHETPFMLTLEDGAHEPETGVTRFRFALRLASALRDGRTHALALCFDTAQGCEVLDERTAHLPAWSPGRWVASVGERRVVIVDPSLKSYRGHQVSVVGLLVRALRRLGCAVDVVGNHAFNGQVIEGVKVHGSLKRSPYDVSSLGTLHERSLRFGKYCTETTTELGAMLNSWPDHSVFIFPTVNEYFLYPLIDAARGRGDREILCLALLMLETGLTRRPDGAMVEDRTVTTLFREAFQLVQTHALEETVRFFAMSATHQHNYQLMTALPIGAVPPLFGYTGDLPAPTRDAPAPQRVLLYVGEAKLDKGFHLAPALIERLQAAHDNLEVVMQIHNAEARRELSAAAAQIRARRHPGLRVIEGFIDHETYMCEMAAADIVVLSYDAERYAAKTSGVLWEADSFGAAIVAPAGGWLEQEMRLSGAVHETFDRREPTEIAAAISRLLARTAGAARRPPRDALRDAEMFLNAAIVADRRRGGYGALFGDGGAGAADRPVRLSERLRLDAADPAFADGWSAPFETEYRRPGRWMSRQAEVALKITRDTPRTLVIRGETEAVPGLAAALRAVEAGGAAPLETTARVSNPRDFHVRIALPAATCEAPTRLRLSIPEDAVASLGGDAADKLLLVTDIEAD